MPIHEILPLLIGAGVAPINVAAGYLGYHASLNPKTALGDAAAQQAKDAREARRLAVHVDFHREGQPHPSELK